MKVPRKLVREVMLYLSETKGMLGTSESLEVQYTRVTALIEALKVYYDGNGNTEKECCAPADCDGGCAVPAQKFSYVLIPGEGLAELDPLVLDIVDSDEVSGKVEVEFDYGWHGKKTTYLLLTYDTKTERQILSLTRDESVIKIYTDEAGETNCHVFKVNRFPTDWATLIPIGKPCKPV